MGLPMPGEWADEGDRLRAQAQQDIADGKLLTEPDGYYSHPLVLGCAYTRNGKMEILGYMPTNT